MTSPENAAAEPAAGANRAPAVRWRVALALFLFAALASRFDRLGDRPLHHDESIHAYQSYTLSQDGNWRYDPAYHGPFLYYANAAVYKIFGVSDTTARLLPAVFGLVLIGFAWPLRRWIGNGAAAAYALLVLLSPHLTYFSRFIREDIYSLVFTLGTILAFRRFLETDRSRWLTASAALFALAGVTKENAYMTGVLFVAFGLWTLLLSAARGAPRGAALRAAAARTAAWVRARWPAILTAGILFLFIWALMYSAFGRYPGDWFAIPKALKYWIGQHEIARIPGPWYYYLPQLAYYETGICLAAVFAFSRRQWGRDPFLRSLLLVAPVFLLLSAVSLVKSDLRPRPLLLLALCWAVAAFLSLFAFKEHDWEVPAFLRFVAFWAFASLALYAWAREKVPWLTVHPLLPLTILAAVGVARLWSERQKRGAMAALGAIAVLALVNASGMLLACFRYGAYDLEREPKHGEYLAYVQTTRDLVRALGVLDRVRGRVPAGQPLITVAGEASWPLTWYLRNTPTTWASRIDQASTPVIVADWDPEGGLQKQLAGKYDARRVPIRAWWFPEPYKGTPEKPEDRPTLGDVWRWWLFHRLWSPIGSQDTTFFVRKDLAGTGPLEPLRLPIQDTSGRDYPSEAVAIPAERSWGASGAGNGEFAEPRGLAAGGRGDLYVADTKNSRIQVFDPSGKFLRAFGRKGPGDGEFNEPCGLAVDSGGEVWVADTWNHRIVHLSGDMQWRGAFNDPDRGLFGPRSVVVSRGFLYVADTGNKRIVRFDRQGKKISEFGAPGSGPGQLVEPVGLAANAAGQIYVADTGNHRVQVFDADGKFLRQFPVFGWKDFYTEPYLALGPGDVVIATDAWGGRVAVYDSSGAFRKSWKAPSDFKAPTGVAVDAFGRLNVSDRGTNRIFSWTLGSLLP